MVTRRTVTRKLSFRSKLVGITALPLALIGYLSVQDVRDALSTRQAAASQLVELDRQAALADLADAISGERGALFDPTATNDDLATTRAVVDDAMARLRAPELDVDAGPLAEAELIHAEVVELRAGIGDDLTVVQAAVSSRENEALLAAIDRFSLLPQQVLAVLDYEVTDRETLANLTTTVLLERAREALALEGTALQQALAEGAPSQSTLETVGARIGSSDGAVNVALDLGVPSTREEISAYLASPAWAEYQALRDRFTRLLIGQRVRIDPGYVLGQRAALAAEFTSREEALRETMNRDTLAIDARASRDLTMAVAVSLGVLALLTAFLFLLARSIRKSLGRLEHRATEIATVELPSIVDLMRTQGDLAEVPSIEEIPVESGDEIGRLSVAFNELHNTAVRLASEQAVSRAVVAHMFVNLGRRNQKLMMRMLQSLDELERNEPDPDRLARLYNLDHLATRMRRNAESLLILADVDVARRFEGPVLVSELLRSTMSEVEEYSRIQLNIMDDAEIAGDAAADLAHLLSELTENAAKFSPPTEPIEVIARYTRLGYILAVIDSGLGLAEEEIASANARIRAAASSAETPSRNLGLFVVGKLAGKYGMEVQIFDRVPAGLTVRVRIPRSMILSQPPAGVIDDGLPALAREPRALPPPEPRAIPVPVGVAGSHEISAGPALAAGPARSPYDHNGRPPSHVPPSIAPPSLPLRLAGIQPTSPHPATTTGPIERVTANGSVSDRQAPAGGTLRAVPSASAAGQTPDPEAVFGTRRRVPGENLPDAIDSGRRQPEPDSAAFRRTAEAVRSDLGALQRGLTGTPARDDRNEMEP